MTPQKNKKTKQTTTKQRNHYILNLYDKNVLLNYVIIRMRIKYWKPTLNPEILIFENMHLLLINQRFCITILLPLV